MPFDKNVIERMTVIGSPHQEWSDVGCATKALRVLHLTSGNLYGGIETMLVTLAKSRQACPLIEQHFAVCFAGRLLSELAAAQAPIHRLGNVRASRPWLLASARRRLRVILEKETFDAVICHSAWPMAMFGYTTLSSKQRLVFWMHGVPTGRHWIDRWAQRNRPELVICNSRYTAQYAPSVYPRAANCVIYCPIETSREANPVQIRDSIRDELGVPPEDRVIIQVSRMEQWKGQLLHLEALAMLRDVPGWRCWMVGGPQRPKEIDYFRRIAARANELGIGGRVHFLGERNDVKNLLLGADLFCQPNLKPEPFGIVFIEALAAGLPVVATAIGGACEIVADDCGVLTPPENAAALAAALRRLIEDSRLRISLSSTGPSRARQLCSPEIRIEEMYRRLASLTQ